MSLPGYTEYWRSQANKSQKNTPKQYTLKHRSINVTNSIKSLNLNKTQCKIIFKFLKNFEGEYQLKDTNWNSALNDWKKFSE